MMSSAERRARLATRHHLVAPTSDVEMAAGDLVGLHSSDPATVYLSSWARVGGFRVGDLEKSLYERRSLVRMLGMRRTMFVVPLDLAAIMDAACTRALAPAEERRLVRMLEAQGIADDGIAWLEEVKAQVMDALVARGEATANELVADVPELGRRLRFGEGKTWGGTVGVSTRVLFLLATQARIIRGRPRGSWISSQYRWAPTATWLTGVPAEMDPSTARADLVRRWLLTYGPGTLADVAWWSGWGVRQAGAALEQAGTVKVQLDEGVGYVFQGDSDPVGDVEPWVALLPALDPTMMGWKQRGWYLGEHQRDLFDRNGNAGPTVWAGGRVVGGWGQRPSGEVAVILLSDVGSETADAVAAKAAVLESWLGEVRVTPRFRTPLDKRLAAAGE
jgi:hypothetical protein